MSFQDLPIRRKVTAVIMLTSLTVLVITVAAFIVYDLLSYRREMLRHLSTLTSIIAENGTAALDFDDEKDAERILATLHAERHVVAAALYNAKDQIFVRYPLDAPIGDFPAIPRPPGVYSEPGHLVFFQPVFQGGHWLGTVYLKSDLRALTERLKLYTGIALLVLMGSALIALIISNALQRRISAPILALTHTAKVISDERDYAVRAPRTTSDELGLLTDAFNLMLTRIQEQTVALQEGEERLRLALEASRTGTWDWNLQTNKVTCDEQTCQLFGISPSTFGGSYDHFIELIHPQDRVGVSYAISSALEHKSAYNGEFRVAHPDGSIRVLGIRGKGFYDGPSGQCTRMTGVLLDVTERKRAEEARSFLAAIVDSSDDAIIGKDLEGRIISWNAGAEQMFGFSAAEMIGQSIQRVVSPDRPDEEVRVLSEVKQGRTRHFETIRVRKNRQPINVSLTASPVKNARGEIIGISSIARDITERRQAQMALERQASVLREQAQMLDLANLMGRDLEDHIILWNSGMEKMYGWAKAEALGRFSHELLGTEFPEPYAAVRAALFAHGHWEGELLHHRKDGQPLRVASQWVLHTDASGRPAAILEINNDITERKRAEEQILRLNAELEQRVQERTAELTAANRELEAFTYSVAHDLRAPLRHIDAFSKILLEDFAAALPQDARRYMQNIRSGSRKMSRLVDDLLNLARVGRQELRREATPLDGLVREAMADLKDETEGRSIDWRIHPLPTVECDPGLMKQVFTNLLSNAVKYTRPRAVARVEIGILEQNGHSTLYIRDNGVGFNMRYADKLFGVFQRLHRAEEFEGTGVGLATVERIIQRHGGSVWAEAAVDQGATFYFTIGEPGQVPQAVVNGPEAI